MDYSLKKVLSGLESYSEEITNIGNNIAEYYHNATPMEEDLFEAVCLIQRAIYKIETVQQECTEKSTRRDIE